MACMGLEKRRGWSSALVVMSVGAACLRIQEQTTMRVCMYIHTYIYTYIHTYIHIFIHKYNKYMPRTTRLLPEVETSGRPWLVVYLLAGDAPAGAELRRLTTQQTFSRAVPEKHTIQDPWMWDKGR
jgi:hypothetical protein